MYCQTEVGHAAKGLPVYLISLKYVTGRRKYMVNSEQHDLLILGQHHSKVKNAEKVQADVVWPNMSTELFSMVPSAVAPLAPEPNIT